MQKKIIALAIASALTVPALAFADTTIYGVLDAGYGQTKADGVGGVSGVTKATDAIGFSTMTSSRLGFMHTEDLGGGMKAMAKIETGIGGNVMSNYTQGKTAGDGTTLDATALGSRELNASLMFNQGTTVKLGYGSTLIRDYSLGYAPDPGGNLVGNILNNNADFGSNRSAGVTVTQAMDKFSVAVQVTAKTTKSNTALDNKGYVVSGTPPVANAGAGLGNGYLIGGQYADGPLSVAAAYQDLEYLFANSPVAQYDVKKKIGILGGSWDFGVAKLIAEYGTDKADDSISGTSTKADGFSIGAQAPFGDILGFVQLSDGKVNNSAADGDRTQKGYTLGGKYNFSKASFGYLSFGENKLAAGNVSAETKVDQFAFGLVHTF